MPTFVDLFCGAGGASTGLESAGWRCIGAYDCDLAAVSVYRARHPNHPVFLQKIDHDTEIPDCDLVWASPPCQPFSRTGKQLGQEDDRDGFPALLSLLARSLPPVVLIENVAQLAAPRHESVLSDVLGRLKAIGYDAAVRVLDSSRFGVPQKRTRVFIACALPPKRFRFPEADSAQTTIEQVGLDPDLPLDPSTEEGDLEVSPAKLKRILRTKVGLQNLAGPETERTLQNAHLQERRRRDQRLGAISASQRPEALPHDRGSRSHPDVSRRLLLRRQTFRRLQTRRQRGPVRAGQKVGTRGSGRVGFGKRPRSRDFGLLRRRALDLKRTGLLLLAKHNKKSFESP